MSAPLTAPTLGTTGLAAMRRLATAAPGTLAPVPHPGDRDVAFEPEELRVVTRRGHEVVAVRETGVRFYGEDL